MVEKASAEFRDKVRNEEELRGKEIKPPMGSTLPLSIIVHMDGLALPTSLDAFRWVQRENRQ